MWISALVLAALALFFPVAVSTGFAFLITAGVFLYGLSQGITYFRSPKENRSGWTLANGSLLVIVSGVALSGALMSELGILRMITILSFAAGFLAASIGVSQIAAGIANKTGREWALLG